MREILVVLYARNQRTVIAKNPVGENLLEALLHLEDVVKLRQEPLVYIGHLPDLVDRVATVESSRNRKDTLVSRIDELLVDILNEIILYSCSLESENQEPKKQVSIGR